MGRFTFHRRSFALAIVFSALVLAGAVWLCYDPEPRYQGRPVSHWLVMYGTVPRRPGAFARIPGDPSIEALDALGETAVRRLRKILRTQDSPFDRLYARLWHRAPARMQKLFPQPVSRLTLRINAAHALGSLGPPLATPAIPDLIHVLRTADNWELLHNLLSGLEALKVDVSDPAHGLRDVLEEIAQDPGPRRQYMLNYLMNQWPPSDLGLPILKCSIQDPHPKTRANSAWLLGQMGSRAQPALPWLLSAAADPDREVRYQAVRAIVATGANDERARAALIRACADEHPMVRTVAERALTALGLLPSNAPENATKQ